jgi:acetoacetyl-CoA synthetase
MGEYINSRDASDELWRHAAPAHTPMWQFIQHVNQKYGLKIDGYPALYQWSVDSVSDFWEEVWAFVGIVASKEADKVTNCPGFFLMFLFWP